MRLQLATRNQMLKQLKVFESTTDGVIVTDGICNITYYNKTIAGLMGLSRQISGANVFEILAGIEVTSVKTDYRWFGKSKTDSVDFYMPVQKMVQVTVFPIPEGIPLCKKCFRLKKAEIQLKKITQAIEQNSFFHSYNGYKWEY